MKLFEKTTPPDSTGEDKNLQGRKSSSYHSSALMFFVAFILLIITFLFLAVEKYLL